MSEELVCAFDFPAKGKLIRLDETRIFDGQPSSGWRWIHLDRSGGKVGKWLSVDAGIPATAVQALLAEETRPSVRQIEDGYLVNLRGVNLNPDALPEDMIAVRIWIDHDGQRIITLRKFKVMAIQGIREECEEGNLPGSIGEFLSRLVLALIERMAPVISGLEDRLDELEELQLEIPTIEHRNQLAGLRRTAITLKRFLSPQKDALLNLSLLQVSWLDTNHIHSIREAHDQTSRMVEALDAIRERSGLLHEAFSSQLADITNRNSYVLTVIAAIFLPLGFLTGLLGINVGGMPGVDNAFAFWWVSIAVVVLAIAEYLLLKWLRWI